MTWPSALVSSVAIVALALLAHHGALTPFAGGSILALAGVHFAQGELARRAP
jgi:hypothetical protein